MAELDSSSLRRSPCFIIHDERPVVMFEFPDMDAIHAFWNSPDYVQIKKLREGIATLNIWAFAGS